MNNLQNVLLKILELTEKMQANLDVSDLFDTICKAIIEDLGWNFSIVVLRDNESRTSKPVAARGLPEEYRQKVLNSEPSKWTNWYKIPEYQVSNSYYVRNISKNIDIVPGEFRDRMKFGDEYTDDPNMWQGDDLLIIPIRVKDEWIGIINVDNPKNGLAPKMDDIQMLELFANQVAIAIHNAKAFERQKDFNKRLSTEVKHKTRLLEEQNRELQTYISSLTHDLKTPLVSINAIISFLEEEVGEEIPDNGKEYLLRLRNNVVKMSKILNDLVSYYNVQKSTTRKTYFDTKKLIKDEFNRVKDMFPDKTIKFNLVGDFPYIYQQKLALSLIFANLLSNALKFSKEENKVEVTVSVENYGTHYQFSIKDDGIGMDEKYAHKIFQLFERLSEKKTEGTGIGLATVKKMLEKIDGKIWVESEKGVGSTFFFNIPIIEDDMGR